MSSLHGISAYKQTSGPSAAVNSVNTLDLKKVIRWWLWEDPPVSLFRRRVIGRTLAMTLAFAEHGHEENVLNAQPL